jgi:hypothetical protein
VTRRLLTALIAMALVAGGNAAHANQIATCGCYRNVTPAEIAAGVPADAQIRKYFITTDSDILAFENLQITKFPVASVLYQHPFGDEQNANPPNPALVPFFPALSADSWFDTPGLTSRLGPDLPGNGQTTFGDLSNDGPQTKFQFAQLTYSPAATSVGLTFRASINSTTNPGVPYSQDFSIEDALTGPVLCIPEPASWALAIAAMFAFAKSARRSAAA